MELRVLNRDLARTFEKLARAVEFKAASERRLHMITNTVPALIAHIDTNERFTFCNQYYKTALGFDIDTMLGRRLGEVFDALAYAIIKPKIKAALAGEVRSFERAIVIHGEQLFQQCEYLPDTDEDGDIIGFYSLVIDVTARRCMNGQTVERKR